MNNNKTIASSPLESDRPAKKQRRENPENDAVFNGHWKAATDAATLLGLPCCSSPPTNSALLWQWLDYCVVEQEHSGDVEDYSTAIDAFCVCLVKGDCGSEKENSSIDLSDDDDDTKLQILARAVVSCCTEGLLDLLEATLKGKCITFLSAVQAQDLVLALVEKRSSQTRAILQQLLSTEHKVYARVAVECLEGSKAIDLLKQDLFRLQCLLRVESVPAALPVFLRKAALSGEAQESLQAADCLVKLAESEKNYDVLDTVVQVVSSRTAHLATKRKILPGLQALLEEGACVEASSTLLEALVGLMKEANNNAVSLVPVCEVFWSIVSSVVGDEDINIDTALLASFCVDALDQARQQSSNEYAIYLGVRTVCRDQSAYFLRQCTPTLCATLASVLEMSEQEAASVTKQAILGFFQNLDRTLARSCLVLQPDVLDALASSEEDAAAQFLFALSEDVTNRVVLARHTGVLLALIRYQRQTSVHSDDYKRQLAALSQLI